MKNRRNHSSHEEEYFFKVSLKTISDVNEFCNVMTGLERFVVAAEARSGKYIVEPKWMWPTYIPEIDIEGLLSTIDSDKLDLVLARISKPEDFISLSREYNQEVIEMDIDFDFDLPEGNSEDFPSVSAAEEPKLFNPVLLLIAVCVLLAIYIFVRLKRPSCNRTPEDVIYDKYNILADFDFVSKETEELVLRVRFSNHPLTKEDLEYMDNQISKLQIKIKEEYSLLRRLKVRIKYGLKVL